MEKANVNNSETGNASRVTKAETKKKYRRKRNRRGVNQYTKTKDVDVDVDVVEDIRTDKDTRRSSVVTEEDKRASVSAQKIKEIVDDDQQNIEGYRLFDMSIFSSLLNLLSCPVCDQNNTLSVTEDEMKRKGLASFLLINCSNYECSFSYSSYTSKGVKNNEKLKEVNARSVYAMRRIGVGHAGLQKFCGVMNMPPPIASKSYNELSEKLGTASEKVAKVSMMEAALEVKAKEGTDVGVSFDGSWQRRGYSSLNGVGTAISVSTGKVLDIEILSRHCKICLNHTSLKESDPVKYDQWKLSHDEVCQLNHIGSSSSMETAAAVAVFNRSVQSNGLRYVKYFGDGDSSAFSAVQNTYNKSGDGVVVKKFECLGHYQKRVGCRLRRLRSKVKGLGGKSKDRVIHETIDGKVVKRTVKGKGKLTDHAINMLQNYFGIALRSGATSVKELQNKLLASFFHLASSSDREYHDYCPATKDSWCQYQRDIANGTNLHKPGKGLDIDVIRHLKTEYLALTNESELSKCLHGQTQNANESFNSLIWERAPKTNYCSLPKLKMCAYDAVSYFNYGGQSIIDTLSLLFIDAGFHTKRHLQYLNTQRTYNAGYKGKSSSKTRRKVIHSFKKKRSDSLKQKEGVTYEAGAFYPK